MNPKSSTGLPSRLKVCSTLLVAAALWNSPALAETPAPGPGVSAPAKAIPWTQLGAAAGAQYSGDGLTVSRTEQGARLRCVFQRLDGEATREGLWLTSTEPDRPNDRFRVIAVELVREGRAGSPLPADGAHGVTRPTRLPAIGEVSVDGQIVRFIRPGLVEEYTVSMDGVRQDFVVLEKPGEASVPASRLASSLAPPTEGQLRVELGVTGAKVEPTVSGVQLVLEKSGRKIAYSRLRVTDATGKELTARMDVAASRQSAAEMKQEDDGGLPTRRYARLAVIVDDAQAVYPIRIDPTFSDANWVSLGDMPGTDRNVYAAVADAAGNLYVGGDFKVAGNVICQGIAKWDGTTWSGLGSGVNGIVRALAVSGNDVYAGGDFITAGVVTVNRVAKWNGTAWSALGSGKSQTVRALAVSGSNVYAGGSFLSSPANEGNYISRWDGSTWRSLGLMDGVVNTIVVSGSNVYVGGDFRNAGSISTSGVAKYNGAWSGLGSGISGTVLTLAVSGSNVYAGGIFNQAGAVTVNRVAKWNGSTWNALGTGMNETVRALLVSGDDVYAGGDFTQAGGSLISGIAKWNGSAWSALEPWEGSVHALAISGTDIYVGGTFSANSYTTANHIARWNGSEWRALGAGSSAPVYALATSGSDVYAGGMFRAAGGSRVNYIAKWSGSNWNVLGSGMTRPVNGLAASGSNVYVGTDRQVMQWNGAAWSSLGLGMNGDVVALAVLGEEVYAGGFFTTVTNNGGITTTVNHIAKWNGSVWDSLGSGMNGAVQTLAASGELIYAGGRFTTAGGSPAYYVAGWNGSDWSTLGSGMSDWVLALGVAGSDIYAGGSFARATNSGKIPVTVNRIAKWNGSAWSPLGPGVNTTVMALAVAGDDVYAGGDFDWAGPIRVDSIGRWDGSNWNTLGSGMDHHVYALVVSGSDVYAGGAFVTAGGKVSSYVAKWAPLVFRANSVTVSNGMFRGLLTGPDTSSVVVDGTSNFADWSPVATNTLPLGGAWQLSLPTGTNPHQFYRARLEP